jgi:hypothetical protein
LKRPKLAVNPTTTTSSGSRDLLHMLQADPTNSPNQVFIGKLRDKFDQSINRLLILDWLTYRNLQRMLLYNNLILEKEQIPSSQTLKRMIDNEYERAIGSATEVPQSARGLIHHTFDGCTSKVKTSFNAHFIDRNWKQWDFLLAVPPLQRRHSHTGQVLADEVVDNLTPQFTLESKRGIAFSSR